ncbi:TadE/TadG family type IV pilus assembly protein [Methylobacterium nigriterrae]|uniref:TadE/TadG family type IV pilus assembly protein n=1 Tax=Methylobacterium nigriterrae TaxID=3127512 RepID=UPI003013C57A
MKPESRDPAARARTPRGGLAASGGASAVEFALVAPILLLLFLGAVEASRAVTAASRAGYVADSIAELVSQTTGTLSTADIDGLIRSAPLIDSDILRYARQVGRRDLDALANVTISSVAFTKAVASCTASCTYLGATVFSRALSGSARPCGAQLPAPDSAATTPLTLPASIFGPVPLVVVDVEVFFRPLVLTALPFPTGFRRSAYFRPRQVARVDSSANCPGF